MIAYPHKRHMSVEEYLVLDENSTQRYEMLNGDVYALAGGTANHSLICANLIRELGNRLRKGPCRAFTSDMRLNLSERNYLYPDVTVSCDQRDRGNVTNIRYPCIVIEVLSPGTEAVDRGRKFDAYRAYPSIREYLLIDSERAMVHLFRRERNTLWTFHVFNTDDEIELQSVNVRLPVSSAYEDVVFENSEGAQ